MPSPSLTLPKGLLYINGQWRAASDGKTAATINPATEQEIMQIAQASEQDVNDAVEAAYSCFHQSSWATMGPHHRATLLHRIADLIDAQADELAYLESLDVGKPLQYSRNIDIDFITGLFRFYAGVASGQLGGQTRLVTPSPSGSMPLAYTRREPLGVVAAITPFNFPLILSCTKIAPALAAGNTFIHKPASATPLSALKMAEIFAQAGVENGVFNLVTGSGSTVGNHLVSHPKVKKIAFTGSTAVGKGIVQRGADTLKKVTLELGGKSANLIFDDANIDQAVSYALFAIFINSGEFCMAGSRLLVQRSVYEEVLYKLEQGAKALVVGDPLNLATNYGPQIDAAAQQKCADYVALGLSDGARLIHGGNKTSVNGKGYFFEPTIIADVSNQSRIAQEEIFGPVLVVIPFDDEQQAVELANESPYGLAAGLHTESLSRAHRVAHALQAGMIWVNTWGQFDPSLPFGGYKASGMGREQAIEAMESYTQHKSVYVNLG